MLEARSCAGLVSVLTLTTFLSTAAAQPPPPPPPDPPPVVDTSATAAPAAQAAAPGGLKVDGTNASLRVGFLLQPAAEYDSATATADVQSTSLYLRRARLMAGVTLGDKVELFAETEAANLGKAGGAAANPGVNIQDAFGTYKPLEELKVDAGLMLIPLSHNGLQGAGTLYGWDYYAYSFQQSNGMTNYFGRDLGLQLRGLVGKKVEYRAAVFQGNRSVPPPPPPGAPPMPLQPRTPLRLSARVQYNFFDAETGYFYGGTYAGAKKILSVGAGIDHQDDYNAVAGDVFFDWPRGADVITAQLNVVHYDGKSWIPSLPKQTATMIEAGYRFGAFQLSPIVRFETLTMANPTAGSPSVMRVAGGIAWWVMSHNANVKLFYTYIRPDSDTLRKVSQINLQMQFYVF
jgi:hypothetical protein